MTESVAGTALSVAWISRGRLFVKRGDGAVQEIESHFAQNALQRELKHAQNNSWKGRSGVWGSMGMQPPGMAPWENEDSRRGMRFVAVSSGDSANEIYYVLDMGPVGGLFKYDFESQEETRLMHQQGFSAQDLSRHSVDGQLAVSLIREDGTVGLAITRHDGLFGRTLALSDSIDEAPSWLPDGSRKLVFQSSAIGRNENGYAIGKSPYRIEQLDLETEQIDNLHEEDGFDLLQPRSLNDGSLLFVRRPYRQDHRQSPSLLEVAQDVLFFPYRLARTFVHMFHFMSMAFSGKPLINAGGPEQNRRSDNPYLMLYGQAVDTRRAMAKGAGKSERWPLVPREWQLIRREADGKETMLAENVLAFDVRADGAIVFTDGRTVYRWLEDGQKRSIASNDIIEKVVVLKQ